jgi:5'-deoxynucleotidase YfbR-like HD superfamily hydrolase
MTPYSEGLLNIAKLSLKFARVNRVTLHEDGERPESDTDHTVMLSLCACALADALYKDKLDTGKVAQFAIVHDLVEVHVGDVNTINISQEDRAQKEERERESLGMIENEFATMYPWIHSTIEEYERRDTPEARFVKMLDKAMSKATNILNKGAALRKLGITHEEIERHFRTQTDEYRQKYGEEFPEVLDILEELMQNMLNEIHV